MSSVTRVPQTSRFAPEELSADDATATLRRVGRRRLAADSFARFRYGDGFTSARALGSQLVLSFLPLVIAVVGLSSTLHVDRLAEVLRRTLLTLSPGTGTDAVKQALERGSASGASGGRLALAVGLLTALVALATSMGRVERAANRIYGVQRDRPATKKYLRATLLAFAGGIPAMLGFLVLVAGGAQLEAVRAGVPAPALPDPEADAEAHRAGSGSPSIVKKVSDAVGASAAAERIRRHTMDTGPRQP